MKEIKTWVAVTDWTDEKRFGLVDLPKEEAAIIELVNGEGHVFRWDDDPENRKVCNGFKPPYTPTKWVYGKVMMEEYRNLDLGEDKYARKILKLTDESVVFDTCEK